jgi:hypothetical protein
MKLKKFVDEKNFHVKIAKFEAQIVRRGRFIGCL